MSNFGFDPFWRWLSSRPSPEELPGFQVPPVDVAPVSVPGLHNWQPPTTGEAPFAPDDILAGTEAAQSPWWERPNEPSNVLDGQPQSPWPWLRAPTNESPGFLPKPEGSTRRVGPDGNIRLMAGALAPIEPQEQLNDVTGSNGMTSSDVIPSLPPNARPWWERPAFEDKPQPQWPWLRVPTDEAPAFRLKPDGSVGTGAPDGNIRLMTGALAPIEPQEQLNDVAGSNGMTLSDVKPSPPPGVPLSPFSAASTAIPASAGGAIDLAALAARVAPAVASAGSAAVAALPLLFYPTNTRSETTDLGDGLRARVRPGQRTVEIERRVDNGLFGTGIMAKWETLPVEAWQHVGRDGSVNTVINHEQLNQALGRSAPAESKAAGTSAMAQSPKDGAPQQAPPTGIVSTADGANNAGNAPATKSLAPAKIDAKVLEEAKQRDPEEERVLACRAVRAMPGQSAPSGQYSGPGAIDTAVNVRVAPGFPAPKGGYGYDPDHLRHWNGYKGELELKNRIERAVPYEKFVHYGNPAGNQGPDVLTIGPDARLMEWDSKSRVAERRVGPGMASKASLKYQLAHDYVWEAIRSRAVAPDAGVKALQQLNDGNYNICTVGTGNAYDGYFESVRKGVPTGRRR
ncbi:MAG: hypothetical protein HYX38_02425 [Rhodospirillales bacterium]|nr:hypothetical protein [Rhodospirillales bacterium]